MAEPSTTLQMKFGTTGGTKTWNYKYAKANASAAAIKNLANVMIANGTIYTNQPLRIISAELVTTSVTTIDVS